MISIPELIGYVASVFTVVSLLMSSVLRLRLINFAATSIWSVYGYLINAPAVIVTNVVLVLVNIYFITRLLMAKEMFHLVEVRKDAVYLGEFLRHFDPEIKKIYPDFEYDSTRNVFTYLALRNVTAAGLFIVEIRDDGRLYLKLDFNIPGYQDFKISRYVYAKNSPVLASIREHGFEAVYSDRPVSPRQEKYLVRMGFEKVEENLYRLPVAA